MDGVVDMARPVVRAAVAADALAIYPNLIERHRKQVDALGQGALGIVASLEASAVTMCGAVGGEVVCLGGVFPVGSALVPAGETWMIHTPGIERHRKAFLRESRRTVHGWLDRFLVLSDFVDVRDGKTLRWLRWIGFRVTDNLRAPDGRTMLRVELRRWA